MRLVIRNAVALLLILFVAKIALQAGPVAETTHAKVPKSLLLSSLSQGEAIPNGHFQTAGVVKKLDRAALQKGL